ncbi:MAG: hypothetical protein QNJ22_10005 [Desulfosarcinaceae bacterium]|nr:hypothetical protein [Desulfosarcinaceae bacterium]
MLHHQVPGVLDGILLERLAELDGGHLMQGLFEYRLDPEVFDIFPQSIEIAPVGRCRGLDLLNHVHVPGGREDVAAAPYRLMNL